LTSAKTMKLSDAKLFEDALKEQKRDRAKDKAALKVDVEAELKKKDSDGMESLKAQRKQMKAELKMIEKADGDVPVKAELKTRKARTQSLAAVEHHKRHRSALAVKKAKHITPRHAVAHRHAAKEVKHEATLTHAVAGKRSSEHAKMHGKLPTDSKLYKDALARQGGPRTYVTRSRSNPAALAKAHAAMLAKAAARKAKEDETVAQEKKLVAFLDSAGGSKVKVFSPTPLVKTLKAHKAVAAKKSAEVKAKLKSVSSVWHTAGKRAHGKKGEGWAQAAMTSAAHSLGHKGKESYHKTEIARADAIEASLVGPSA